MHFVTVDLETTANGGIKNSPEAHYRNNRVLACGFHEDGTTYINDTTTHLVARLIDLVAQDEDVTLVGHNLKFDLKYLMRSHPEGPWNKLNYHCTMYQEYRASGHKHRFMSLEDACDMRHVPYKKSLDLGAWIKAGNKMEDIPKADLESYLEDDVVHTMQLHSAQIMNAEYYECWQNHIPALASMELLGLPIDKALLMDRMSKAVVERDTHFADIWTYVTDNLEWSDGIQLVPKDLKATAPRTISYLLTGEPAAGLTKAVRRNIVWKTGHKPMLNKPQIHALWGNVLPTNLGYPLAKGKLDDVARMFTSTAATNLVEAVIKFRAIDKLIGTYYGPFLEELDATGQGRIYPKLNMAATGTGRLSSSNPNGQNMPPEARNLCEASNGTMFEIDFKQLEVVGLAVLSKDPTLINDLMLGKDIHFESGKTVMGWTNPSDMTDKDRKIVKGVNFGLIYGGGAKGISLSTGTDVKIVKALIKSFYGRYPGVADWQEDFYTSVTSKLAVAGMEKGEQIYHSLVEDPTSGRRFYFKEAPAPQWVRAKTGRRFSFKPTETKNYPVQGFAGGDIVMVALTLLWERLYHRESTEIRMTVHDSILVDTGMTETELRTIMDDVCAETMHIIGITVPLTFDITSGIYWQ